MAADPTLADEAFLLGRAAWHRAKADDMSDVRDARLHRTHHIGLAGRMEEIAVRLRKLDAIEEAADRHLIQFRDDGWTIAHPVSERLDLDTLFDCSIRWEGDDPGVCGVFELLDGETLGEEVHRG